MPTLLLVLFTCFASSTSHATTVSSHTEKIVPPILKHFAALVKTVPPYNACQKQVKELIDGLKCEVPKERKLPPKSRHELGEYALQMAAKSQKISYEKLNALVDLTKTDSGREKLAAYFTGLACGGADGDPIAGRKNWRTFLPACPAEAPSGAPWVSDPKPAIHKFHPGADSCWRKPATRGQDCPAAKSVWECINGDWLKEQPTAVAAILKDHPPAQQCCYGKSGLLIKDGPGAGTPDTIFSARVIEDVVSDPEDEGATPMEPAGLVKRTREKILSLENRLKDGHAAIEHNILDARLISACMKDWPGEDDQHVKTYHALGWGPLN